MPDTSNTIAENVTLQAETPVSAEQIQATPSSIAGDGAPTVNQLQGQQETQVPVAQAQPERHPDGTVQASQPVVVPSVPSSDPAPDTSKAQTDGAVTHTQIERVAQADVPVADSPHLTHMPEQLVIEQTFQANDDQPVAYQQKTFRERVSAVLPEDLNHIHLLEVAKSGEENGEHITNYTLRFQSDAIGPDRQAIDAQNVVKALSDASYASGFDAVAYTIEDGKKVRGWTTTVTTKRIEAENNKEAPLGLSK